MAGLHMEAVLTCVTTCVTCCMTSTSCAGNTQPLSVLFSCLICEQAPLQPNRAPAMQRIRPLTGSCFAVLRHGYACTLVHPLRPPVSKVACRMGGGA
jgi:hypothetical protein